jgi:hypothetical protein
VFLENKVERNGFYSQERVKPYDKRLSDEELAEIEKSNKFNELRRNFSYFDDLLQYLYYE